MARVRFGRFNYCAPNQNRHSLIPFRTSGGRKTRKTIYRCSSLLIYNYNLTYIKSSYTLNMRKSVFFFNRFIRTIIWTFFNTIISCVFIFLDSISLWEFFQNANTITILYFSSCVKNMQTASYFQNIVHLVLKSSNLFETLVKWK